MSLPRACATFVAALVFARCSDAQEPAVPRLRSVVIEADDVFTAEESDHNLFYWFANALHVTTHDAVIAREIWMRPNDQVTTAEVEEVERNLRALGLFGSVHAELRPVPAEEVDNKPVAGDPVAERWSDLVVKTRDRFSLAATVTIGRVGGVNKIGFRLADSNLLGSGKALVGVSNYAGDEHTQYVRITDPQFLGSRLVANLQTGSTEEGAFTNFELLRPFRRLDDPLSYGVAFADVDENVDYYREGETTAEVPRHRQSVRLFGAAADGPRELRSALGLDVRMQRQDFEPAFGPTAGTIRVPGDTREIEVGPYWTLDWKPSFEIVRRLDSLDYDEDVTLGTQTSIRLAERWRDEQGVGEALQPVLDLTAKAAFKPVTDVYVSLETEGSARFDNDRVVGYQTSAAMHAYCLSLPAQTLAGSITFDAVGETQDLTPQLTLGEDNGLRGYPAREFTGTRRVRLNLENRIDTGLEILSVRVGTVAFVDVGWMHGADVGLSLGQPIRSAGVGLRFGSSHLFGGRVARFDVAWPFDEPYGQKYGVSVSFTVGQVFSFFGNQTELSTEF